MINVLREWNISSLNYICHDWSSSSNFTSTNSQVMINMLSISLPIIAVVVGIILLSAFIMVYMYLNPRLLKVTDFGFTHNLKFSICDTSIKQTIAMWIVFLILQGYS